MKPIYAPKLTEPFKVYAYSDGVGLHGESSTLYMLPVFSRDAYHRWELRERLIFYSGYARLLRVETLSQMEVAR